MERPLPILKKKIALRLGRNTSLFIDLETGVTGLRGAARERRSRLGAVPARLRKGAARVGLARPPAGKPVIRGRDRPVRGSNTPVFFVTGLGKSGTSWLMRTLDGHPEILCKGEGRFFGGEWRRPNFKITQKPVLASSFYNALLSSEDLKLWIERSVWTKDGDPDVQLVRLARVAVNFFLTEALAKTDKKIVGDKTPLLSPEFVEEIHLI